MNYKQLGSDPRLWLAVGLGSGLSPKAPGTMGTVLGLIIYLILPPLTEIQAIICWLTATFNAIYVADIAEKKFGVPDHPSIVIDEIVGFWIAVFLLPTGWMWLLLAFGLFRLFDIWKPWPISWVQEHVPGGLGCVGDDVLAGIFSFATLQILYHLFIITDLNHWFLKW